MKRALLIDQTWAPLKIITSQRAVVLVMKGTAEIVETWDDNHDIQTPSCRIKSPAVIRLMKPCKQSWKRSVPKFKRRIMFNRDRYRCAYCACILSGNSTTVDHITPVSVGGETTWLNCVTSCKFCNRKKANKTLAEIGMKLLTQPRFPQAPDFVDFLSDDDWHSAWDSFFPTKRNS